LNWQFYWGTLDADRNVPLYARCISTFVVLLPALDVASAFPLNAITLGNSLMSAYYGSHIHSIGQVEYNRSLSMFRLAAAVPPVIAAGLSSNLGFTTHLAGIAGLLIAFVFPALLAIYSKKLLQSFEVNHKTHYSCWLTSDFILRLSLGTGLLLIVFISTSMIVIGPPP
jgi:hypothetical protein